MNQSLILTVLVGALLLAGCGGRESPELGAREWMQALASLDGLKLDERTCSLQKAQLQQGGLMLLVLTAFGKDLLGDSMKVNIDTKNLNVELLKTTGNSALVKVQGQMRAGIGLAVMPQDVDAIWQMVKEDGIWKYCGEANASALKEAGVFARVAGQVFGPADLPKMVLQANDFPTGERYSATVESSAIVDTVFKWEPELASECNPLTAEYVEIHNPDAFTIRSAAVLFEDFVQARQCFPKAAQAIQFQVAVHGWNTPQQLLTSELTDQGAGFSAADPESTGRQSTAFLSRMGNVILLLQCQDEAEQPSCGEASTRSLMEKVQSRAN